MPPSMKVPTEAQKSNVSSPTIRHHRTTAPNDQYTTVKHVPSC